MLFLAEIIGNDLIEVKSEDHEDNVVEDEKTQRCANRGIVNKFSKITPTNTRILLVETKNIILDKLSKQNNENWFTSASTRRNTFEEIEILL